MNLMNKLLKQRGAASDLARQAQISPSSIADFRSGARRPSKATACKIASALGYPVQKIFPNYAGFVGQDEVCQ